MHNSIHSCSILAKFSIVYWLGMIERGLEFLFLWNKSKSRLHDKETHDDGPESPHAHTLTHRALLSPSAGQPSSRRGSPSWCSAASSPPSFSPSTCSSWGSFEIFSHDHAVLLKTSNLPLLTFLFRMQKLNSWLLVQRSFKSRLHPVCLWFSWPISNDISKTCDLDTIVIFYPQVCCIYYFYMQ